MKFLALFFLATCLICSASFAQPNQNTHKISSKRDSIVLVGPPPFHFKIQVFRGNKKIIHYAHKELQINSIDSEGKESNWFTEYRHGPESFYIIKAFTGPQPDRFLVIRNTKKETTIPGMTDPNSAEIFGDVDHDGKFEIGGVTLFCQGGDPNCLPEDHCRSSS